MTNVDLICCSLFKIASCYAHFVKLKVSGIAMFLVALVQTFGNGLLELS